MTIPDKNYIYIPKLVIDLIRFDEKLKLIFQSEFPDIHNDFESAINNPNCGCVDRVEVKIAENQEKSIDLINEYIKDKNDIQIKNIINTDYRLMEEPENFSGKMFIIENNEQSFSEFITYLNTQMVYYRTFSTSIGPDNKLYLYFI